MEAIRTVAAGVMLVCLTGCMPVGPTITPSDSPIIRSATPPNVIMCQAPDAATTNAMTSIAQDQSPVGCVIELLGPQVVIADSAWEVLAFSWIGRSPTTIHSGPILIYQAPIGSTDVSTWVDITDQPYIDDPYVNHPELTQEQSEVFNAAYLAKTCMMGG